MTRNRKKSFKIRDFAYETFVGRIIRKLVVPLVRAWFSTCRVTILNEQIYNEYFFNEVPFVGGTWHRAAVYFLYFFSHLRPMIMISRSKDGELLANYAAGFGVVPARGSSKKGGRDALKQMQHYLRSGGKACGTVLDGPQGPAYVAKKGMIVLCRLSGSPFIPVMWSAKRTMTIRNSWDKMMLPLPWSRIYVAIGEPIHIPPDTKNDELEYYRKLIEDRLNNMMAEVDRRCGYS